MANTKKTTSDASKILKRMTANNQKLKALVADAKINAEVAQLIYFHRNRAKLTQSQLAQKIGSTQSVIARLEDADYEGHSLTMLQKIAKALNKHLSISFEPESKAA